MESTSLCCILQERNEGMVVATTKEYSREPKVYRFKYIRCGQGKQLYENGHRHCTSLILQKPLPGASISFSFSSSSIFLLASSLIYLPSQCSTSPPHITLSSLHLLHFPSPQHSDSTSSSSLTPKLNLLRISEPISFISLPREHQKMMTIYLDRLNYASSTLDCQERRLFFTPLFVATHRALW